MKKIEYNLHNKNFVVILYFIFSEMRRKNTEKEERLSCFAKAMGHPTRIAILKFLASRTDSFFGDIHDVLPIAKSYGIATTHAAEKLRTDTRRDFPSKDEILHQSCKLGNSKRTV